MSEPFAVNVCWGSLDFPIGRWTPSPYLKMSAAEQWADNTRRGAWPEWCDPKPPAPCDPCATYSETKKG